MTQRAAWLLVPSSDLDWSQLNVIVAGAGVTGRSVARVMATRARSVAVVDDAHRGDPEARERVAGELPDGVRLITSPAASETLDAADVIVASPGWRLDAPLFSAAQQHGVAVWGDIDLAWVLQAQGRRPDTVWLPLTGTNGKSTTVRMLESILRASGVSAMAVGNIGTPVVDAVCDDDPPEVLALEVSSLQLSRSTVMQPRAAAVLNLAPDHLDWHGGWDNYFAAKARVYERAVDACVFNTADESTRRMVESADVREGCRGVGVTMGAPALGQLGVVDDLLVDRAFSSDRASHGTELASFDDVLPFAPHNVTNALFAGALALSAGVGPADVRQGLRDFTPEPHRIASLGTIDGVNFVDDSKATNPHAARASLTSFEPVVWVAGGLAKGVTFDELVVAVAPRLAGVVLVGADRARIAEALARHAPQVPVIDADDAETDPMTLMRAVVRAARSMAPVGATVLLAPACASMDRFADYHQRGEAFAAAVAEAAS